MNPTTIPIADFDDPEFDALDAGYVNYDDDVEALYAAEYGYEDYEPNPYDGTYSEE